VDPRTQPPSWRMDFHYWQFRVKVHTLQPLILLPHPHSRGVHRLRWFFATIAPLSLEAISNHIPSALMRSNHRTPCGFHVWLPPSPIYPWSNTHPLHIDYPHTILYVNLSFWNCHGVTCSQNHYQHILMMPMLTSTHRDDASVDLNSSNRVDLSSFERVNMSCS